MNLADLPDEEVWAVFHILENPQIYESLEETLSLYHKSGQINGEGAHELENLLMR